MKKTLKTLMAAMFLTALGTVEAQAQRVKINFTDQEPVRYDVSKIESIEFEEDAPIETPDYVDLGLPSGTLWATMNVGAASPEQCGGFYAWGETETKDTYSWATYSYCNGSATSLTKYCLRSNYGTVDGQKALQPEDDAAEAVLGEGWSVPTKEQFEELANESYTTWEADELNGVQGVRITSRSTDASIFLPIGGYMDGTIIFGSQSGYFWTRETHSSIDYIAKAFSVGASLDTDNSKSRYLGLNIRPVYDKTKAHDSVEIGGLKWATMNVGATTVAGSYETCVGDYFAWGETEPRYSAINWTSETTAEFTWKPGQELGYTSDNPISYTGSSLDEEHDAAVANWGEGWRTPSKNDYLALFKACTGSEDDTQTPVVLTNPITEGGIYWLTEEQQIEKEYTGVCGTLFVSKDDISKRVFFPSANFAGKGFNIFYDIRRKIYAGSYITIDEYMGMAAKADFKETKIYINGAAKTTGWPVRAVKD